MRRLLSRLRVLLGREVPLEPREGATCYRTRAGFLLTATCVSEAGFGYDSEPFMMLPPTSTDDEIGEVLRSCTTIYDSPLVKDG